MMNNNPYDPQSNNNSYDSQNNNPYNPQSNNNPYDQQNNTNFIPPNPFSETSNEQNSFSPSPQNVPPYQPHQHFVPTQNSIFSEGQNNAFNYPPPPQGTPYGPPEGEYPPVNFSYPPQNQPYENDSKNTASMVLGIVSLSMLIVCCWLPFLAIIPAIISLVLSKERNSSGKAKSGFIMSIISIVLAALITIFCILFLYIPMAEDDSFYGNYYNDYNDQYETSYNDFFAGYINSSDLHFEVQ